MQKKLFGIFCRNNSTIPPLALEKMQAAMVDKGECRCAIWTGNGIGLGCNSDSMSSNTLVTSQVPAYERDDVVFVASGRVDNADEISSQIGIPKSESKLLSDYEIMRQAYLKWGEDSSVRIFGDWAFAAWHPREKRLFLSRDHHGNTSLYYYSDQHIFAFSTSLQALLSLNLAPVKLDELYLAQYLITWTAYQGERTLHQPIKRLPPAHQLEVNLNALAIHRYWCLENTDELRYTNRDDYVSAFRELFDEAVRCRLRSNGPVAVTLSGGLDSSSVASTAAKFLSVNNKRLIAFSSIPFYSTVPYVNDRFGNEFPYAQATAQYSGNIDLFPLSSSSISPIAGIRRILQLNIDPIHGASNLYWLLDLWQSAKEHKCEVLLTGSLGNGGVSWTGDIFSQSWPFLVSNLRRDKLIQSLLVRLKNKIKLALPIAAFAAIRMRKANQKNWICETAIHSEFARRIKLLEQKLHDPGEFPLLSPKEKRCKLIKPGRFIGGAFEAEVGAAFGLEIRDPTADARVLEYVLSVPDRVFMDATTGIDRWLIRETMKGRLPDEVRLNRNRGRQAGDLVPRLRASAIEVELALDELSRGPAAAYIDVAYMRQVWKMIQTEDTNNAFNKAVTVLTRGIMGGLFVNKFYE